MKFPDWLAALPQQENYRRAVEKSVEILRRQTPEQIQWLGATATQGLWRLAALEDFLLVHADSGRVTLSRNEPVGPARQILALHYLGITCRPELKPPRIAFADLESCRGYAGVYQRRVIGRLCATAGRDLAALAAAAHRLAASRVDGGDAAFELAVFPRLQLRLIWHAGDEEFSPSATFLLPDNVEELFCTEDIVVLCECCVARLAGHPF